MDELRVRGRQEIAKLGERFLRLSEGEMSDRSFLGYVKPTSRRSTAEATAESIFERIHTQCSSDRYPGHNLFFPAFRCRAEIADRMRQQFPLESELIIDRADRAIQGRFDLLGFKDLTFGNPPDWLLEPISGKRGSLDHWAKINYLDPAVAGDKKITWELNRHQHFVSLGQAYWMTADAKYAEAFITQVTSWMDANPPKRGINWASSLELALRSISWLWALNFFADSPCLTAGFKLRVLKFLIAHGLHVRSYLSHYFSPNTHLTGEALGLLYLGTVLEELRCAENWRKLGRKIMLEQARRQIRSDGVYFEQSTYYHRYTADFYTHFLILSRVGKIALPIEVEEKLEKMITHLMWITRPDGSSPLMGDDDGGRLVVLGPREPNDFRDTVATAAALFGRGDWKRVAGNTAVETLWLLGPKAVDRYASLPTDEPSTSSCVFPAGGYSVVRDGWSGDSSYALMDCGPHGSLAYAHAHADALSIEFAALGKTWIVDPGTFTYTGDPELREWFRSTKAHSTVTVDGKSQSVTAGPFSWKHVARTSLDEFIVEDGIDYIEASHDGYGRLADPVKHTRTVISPKKNAPCNREAPLPSYLIVHDAFVAADQHHYAIRYHLAPGCSAFASENHVTVTNSDGRRLNITVFSKSRIRARVIRSKVSLAYGRLDPSLIVVFEAREKGPQEFTTLIIPANAGQSITVDHWPVDFESARAFQIISDSVRDFVMINCATRVIKFGPLSASGLFAWARFEREAFAKALLVGGQRLETSDGFAFRSVSPVSHCMFKREMNGIVGSLNDEKVFDLSFSEETTSGEINGKSFEVCQPVSFFAGAGSAWSAVDNTSEAVN
jgi:hypothetical protein